MKFLRKSYLFSIVLLSGLMLWLVTVPSSAKLKKSLQTLDKIYGRKSTTSRLPARAAKITGGGEVYVAHYSNNGIIYRINNSK